MTSAVGSHTWLVAAAYVAAGLIGGVALRAILTRLRRRAEATRWRGIALAFLRTVAPWGFVAGCTWAAVLALPLKTAYRHDVNHALLAIIIIVISIGSAKVAGEVVRNGAVSHAGTSGSATIFVSITKVIVWTLGSLVLLNSIGVAITPLLTALGVGGLAVALALQDTLTNLFAGVHILTSRKVQPGDFIQLDNGMQGFVVDTNWRNTTIRQLPNNIIVVPNATVASSIVTNYHLPQQEMSVTVQVGVGYDSDLEHVERVTCEVGREVMQEVEGAVPAHEPTVRFHTFGDCGVNFNVGLRTSEVTAQYLVVHEFIKRLHSRYRKEGIEMPTALQTIVYPGSVEPAGTAG